LLLGQLARERGVDRLDRLRIAGVDVAGLVFFFTGVVVFGGFRLVGLGRLGGVRVFANDDGVAGRALSERALGRSELRPLFCSAAAPASTAPYC
jgi:hypothetical protein